LDIMYPDPVIRRDPRESFQGHTAVAADAAAFGDILKTSGAEFAPTSIFVTGLGYKNFPQVVAVQGTDPNTITSATQSDPAVAVVYWSPAGIVLNIAGVTNGGTADVDYAFKLFGPAAAQANWYNLGTGTFKYRPTGITSSGFTGVDFGVNAFSSINRGDLDLASADWTHKEVTGDNQKTAQPDVIFVQFSGYQFLDWDSQDAFDMASPYSTSNTLLRFTHDDEPGHGQTNDVPLIARTIDATGNVIATFCPTTEYFVDPGNPAGTGFLRTGPDKYFISLVDQQDNNQNFEFPTELTVSGTNPHL
jgi:hypothetical protein